MRKKITVALVGQPNVGKSMLTNAISHAHFKVGNFSGVTVEKKSITFTYEEHELTLIDLPGLYALSEHGEDEKVTTKFLKYEPYDLIVNVVDATNLERNLALTVQLLGLEKRMVVALNMMDEAKEEGIAIDHTQLSNLLGVPVIPVSALTKEGIDTLFSRAVDVVKFPYEPSKIIYSDPIEEEVANIIAFLEAKNFDPTKYEHIGGMRYRRIALNLLRQEKNTYRALHDRPIWMELHDIVIEAHKHIYLHHDSQDMHEIFAYERAAIAKGLVAETVTHKRRIIKDLTQRIDAVLIHRIWGIPVFLFLMWLMFQATFELGALPMDMIDAGIVAFGDAVGNHIAHEALRSLIVDGVIAGVGAVLLFLPNILILFAGIALLETTGYMARVAFILDGFFHRFGLHGKSFIPLVTGFGCSVPAYMSARILKSKRDRLLTLFIIGFMSCGARLPIYVLFISAFFAPNIAGNVLFGIYLLGALIGLILAKILKLLVFKGEDEPFVMEMPKYRMPSLRLVWHTVASNAIQYLKKAGGFILAASMLIWFASNYPKMPDIEASYATQIAQSSDANSSALEHERDKVLLENSYLGMLGKATEPLFLPIGLDWKMTVALETGLAAKEMVVATLGVLYSVGGDVSENDEGLAKKIRDNIALPSAAAFVMFVMLYLPCLAASTVFVREAGHPKYLLYLILLTTGVAYVMAFVAYHVTAWVIG
ncbi:MAG: ferrous iron transporter B [Sulfuricurvum sp. PC08-66]|nr:MAG: ferrous iron transporter B [Sulfuricurvum sp. PC08-66]